MQVEIDIKFEQLLKIVKELSFGQLRQLKAEIERETERSKSKNFEMLLLSGTCCYKKTVEHYQIIWVDTSIFIDYYPNTDKKNPIRYRQSC